MQKQKIAEKLIEFRVAKGLTQDDVAKMLEISNRTVSKWETGASLPDLPTLIKLAKCYDVSTDALLGLAPEREQDARSAIDPLFVGKGRKAVTLTSFEIARALAPSILLNTDFRNGSAEKDDEAPPFPTDHSQYYRSHIATNELFLFSIHSQDVNLAITLLRNEENFAWLKDPEKQKKLIRIFRFLADEETLSLLYFIHSTECSDNFTASYIAEHTGLSEERTRDILNEFCAVGACACKTAHLVEGDLQIYESHGDGLLLAMLSIAQDRSFGKSIYSYCHDKSSKMIGDVRNEPIG